MGKSELDADQVSRRSFLKGTLALGTAVSLFGCSVEDNSPLGRNYSYTPNLSSGYQPGALETDVITGATPHNCGGENCILKAYVSGGRITRIVTDERTDIAMTSGGGMITRRIEHVLDAGEENQLFTIQTV